MADDVEDRVIACLQAAFPDLATADAHAASTETLKGWDSKSTLTVVSLVEEEFNIWIGFDKASKMTSFEQIVELVRSKL